MRFRAKSVQAPTEDLPVTMLELFFDLVFVFVITQLTTLLIHTPSWSGYAQAALILVVTWWMYNGFAWLANNVPPLTTATRLPMLLAMTCFLAMAVVLPQAFAGGAWTFAIAYLVVVVIHGLQFTRSSLGESSQAIRRVLPTNFGCAGLLIVAAVLGPGWNWLPWVLAAVPLAIYFVVRHASGFTLRSRHFAERHGLLIIIALGETIVETGVSVQRRLTQPSVALAFVGAMVLISGLWWIYFGVEDDERGLERVLATPDADRTTLSARAYSQAHLLHIAGLVLAAAGLYVVIHRPTEALGWTAALTLAGGVALFLVAQAAYRMVLRIGPAQPHQVAATGILLLSGIGVLASGLVLLICVAAVLVALTVVLQRRAELPGKLGDVETGERADTI